MHSPSNYASTVKVIMRGVLCVREQRAPTRNEVERNEVERNEVERNEV